MVSETPTLVIQYELNGLDQIAHLAVMRPGSINAHSYPEWENHEKLAIYFCTRVIPQYSGWDAFSVEALDRIRADSRCSFCRICFQQEVR